jgi:hypothetical protein
MEGDYKSDFFLKKKMKKKKKISYRDTRIGNTESNNIKNKT